MKLTKEQYEKEVKYEKFLHIYLIFSYGIMFTFLSGLGAFFFVILTLNSLLFAVFISSLVSGVILSYILYNELTVLKYNLEKLKENFKK